MKKYLTFISLILFLNVTAQQQKLSLASDIWPPFTDVPAKASLAMDIVDTALNRMNIEVEFNILNFGDVVDGLWSAGYDGSAALWYTEERELILEFSEPYLQNQLILVGKKGADVSYSSIKDLSNVSIGVVKNYAYGEELTNAENITLVAGNNDQENLEQLLSNNLDYILVDAILIQYLLKFQINDVSELLSIGSAPLITKSLHFAINNDIPDAEEIIKRFNYEIDNMIKDGTYNDILGLNWIQADVDGDGKMELVLDGDRAGSNAPGQVYNVSANKPVPGTNRYYIEGEIYDGWNNIPERYKKDAMQGAGPSPSQVGFKL